MIFNGEVTFCSSMFVLNDLLQKGDKIGSIRENVPPIAKIKKTYCLPILYKADDYTQLKDENYPSQWEKDWQV